MKGQADRSSLRSASRLDVLRRLELLDAPVDDAFDRLTRLATRLTGAPVGLAVLVDEDRQFFVSQIGLGEPWASRRETPLSHSFCQHVVTAGAPLIVEDARVDGLLKDNVAISELDIVAYAGVPLICDGETVGSFCLIDHKPRAWSDDDLDALRDLAAAATSELSLRIAAAERQLQLKRVTEAEARYRSVVTALSEGVVLQDRDGVILTCNEAAERILGLTADQMSGRSSSDPQWRAIRADGSEFAGEEHPAMLTLRTGASARDVVMGVHKPIGGLTWISISTEPLFDPGENTPRAVVSIFADVTQKRAAEAAAAHYTREQEALRELATLVASETQPSAVFAAAAQHMARVFAAQNSKIVRLEPTGEARIVGTWSAEGVPGLPLGGVIDLSAPSATAQALRTGAPIQVGHQEDALAILGGGAGVPARSGMSSPVSIDGRLWGTVSINWAEGLEVDAPDPQRLARFADLVRLAITSAEAREQLSLMASTDHLTGLCNQRVFSDRLEEEVRRSRRHGRSLSLIVFDIDYFKLVNDAHGHEVGNRALTEFARRLVGVRRSGEIVARVGGEEFAWLIPETTGQDALKAAERARAAIAGVPFAEVGRLTTSAGICSLEHAADASELFRHADLALYWAKANGRNTTFLYTSETLSLLSGDQHAERLEHAKTLAAVRALAAAVDAKDPSTQRHSERVARIAEELARAAGWDPARAARLRDAAFVHDVGKIGVPDQVLHKPGKLTAEEYEQVKGHSALGAQMLFGLLSTEQVDWIRHHHEHYDGAGYPDGLAGEEIPEGACLLAIADAWDAMTVARPYGAPRKTEDAIREIHAHAGTQFSPGAITAFDRVAEATELLTSP